MSFPINTAIPNLPNNPVNDVPLMQTNFANISGFLGVDHVAPGATNAGIHQQVHLVNESAPGLIGTGGVLYANLISGNSFPFWQNALGSFPLFSPVTASASGMITLPGGIILMWGSVASTTNGTVGFSPNFPNNAFVVMTQPYYTGAPPSSGGVATVAVLNPITAAGFTWKFLTPSGAYGGFYWFALGN